MFLLWLRVFRRMQKRRNARREERKKKQQMVKIVKREIRESANCLQTLSEEDFKDIFRLNKSIYRKLLKLIIPHMTTRQRISGLSREQRVLNGLRLFLVGFYQRPIGKDNIMPMSQPSVSRCVTEVARVINEVLGDRYLRFPTNTEEKNAIKLAFFEKYNFPGVVGCVDCMHIAIRQPGKDVEKEYLSTKHKCHTISVQMVCDSNLRILHMNSKHGGSVDDSFIFSNSLVNHHLQEKHSMGESDTWLLGDSKYSQLPWLMTPLETPKTPKEVKYNESHKAVRSTISDCISVLRSRFGCLSRARPLMYTPERAANIISACCILHNILIEEGYPLPTEEELNRERDPPEDSSVPDDKTKLLQLQGEIVKGLVLNGANGTTATLRGCVPWNISCNDVPDNPSIVVNDCALCSEDLCNSSVKISGGFFAILTVFVSLILSREF